MYSQKVHFQANSEAVNIEAGENIKINIDKSCFCVVGIIASIIFVLAVGLFVMNYI